MKKVRRRYLALKIDSPETFEAKEFMDAVWSAILKLYGEYGASKTGLILIDYNVEGKTAVIRAAHETLTMVRAAIAAITQINNKPAALHVVAVSGTIKAIYKKLKT